MIITKLQGGLGNQMFQYAVAKGISINGQSIIIDTSFLKINKIASQDFTPREYELKLFEDLEARPINNILLKAIYGQKSIHKMLKKMLLPRLLYVKQKDYEYIDFTKYSGRNIYLDGYFQSERYFSHSRNELLSNFKFPSLDKKNIIVAKEISSLANSVSLHIRRGDYLKPKVKEHHGILPLSYYYKSASIIEANLITPHYFIFSDDPSWCRENLKLNGEFTFIDWNNGEDSWKDMYLMTLCRHHILANSSFSWWGAWLSKHEGINLAPCNWFNPKVVHFNITDFVPERWQIVYYE